jgi:solute carrier family 25 S-adenosylmethionine transporter 26
MQWSPGLRHCFLLAAVVLGLPRGAQSLRLTNPTARKLLKVQQGTDHLTSSRPVAIANKPLESLEQAVPLAVPQQSSDPPSASRQQGINAAVTVAGVLSVVIVFAALLPALAPVGTGAPSVDLEPFRPWTSMEAGAAAGVVRAMSRSLTFGLDTIKTRQQLSRLPESVLLELPPEQRAVVEKKKAQSSPPLKDLYAGYVPFVLQAGPSNAIFFLCYDGLSTLLSCLLPATNVNILRVIASTLATVPTSMIRVPPEVIKQRLQSREGGGTTSWIGLAQDIVREEGWGGIYLGCESQLLRELPFNVLQFVVYDWLQDAPGIISAFGDSLVTDAGLGAAASGVAAAFTHPFDVLKTRQMTNTVPRLNPGVGGAKAKKNDLVQDVLAIVKNEGLGTLLLGLGPRIGLVTTGGAFYFVAQEALRHIMALPSA